jgi:hypothetical protein
MQCPGQIHFERANAFMADINEAKAKLSAQFAYITRSGMTQH